MLEREETLDNHLIYAISESDASSLVDIVNSAIHQTQQPFEVEVFTKVDNQWDLERILLLMINEGKSPFVIFTLESASLNSYIKNFCDLHQIQYIDALSPLIYALQRRSNSFSEEQPKNLFHDTFFRRYSAFDFASRYDDGKDPKGILTADLVLVGISRTQKTPLAVYLANRNYRVANIPLVPESQPPKELFDLSTSRIFGLTSSPLHLQELRRERLKSLGLPSSAEYASKERINEELQYAHGIMRQLGCPIIDVSTKAVEETADIIIRHLDKNRMM